MYGDVVLKQHSTGYAAAAEAKALREYGNCHKFCKLYEYDTENHTLLLERMIPGTPLKHEAASEKRLDVFLSLYKDLHKKPENPSKFPTYVQWVQNASAYLQGKPDHKNIYEYMLKASDICSELVARYPVQFLLHGDFHFDNILLDKGGDYKIIDPKGVLGHPLFDLPRYLLNEYWLMCRTTNDAAEHLKIMSHIINYFASTLSIPQDDIRKSYYVEAAMANSWLIEDGRQPMMDDIYFALRLL